MDCLIHNARMSRRGRISNESIPDIMNATERVLQCITKIQDLKWYGHIQGWLVANTDVQKNTYTFLETRRHQTHSGTSWIRERAGLEEKNLVKDNGNRANVIFISCVCLEL